MKRILCALCILWAGCTGPVMETKKVNSYDVQLIFEIDDCKVYRFNDGGHNHYFVNRSGGQTMTYQQDGEDSTHPETIQTRQLYIMT